MIAKIKTLPIDPRLIVFTNNFGLVVIGSLLLRLQRTWEQIVLALCAAMVTEIVYSLITEKHAQFSWRNRLISSIVPCAGLLLYLRSTHVWFYAVAVFIAISSKYLIRYRKNSSVFNPIAFAIVFTLAFLPLDWVFIKPDQFSNDTYPIVQALILGTILVIRADRWILSVSYYGTIFLTAAVCALFFGSSFWWIMGPELSLLLIVFAFFMITEPKTSPTTRHGQLVFGAAVALLHLGFRYYEILYSEFLALFIMCAVRPFFENFFDGDAKLGWRDVSNHFLLPQRAK